ncbi:unnamed protein product [Oikopleura dioica]|uniref:Uncharacterized protein n=1 Tax=Oikopleura dioica TaxID=34765 RepID=E4XXS0_OIKDI|nr:unnamed protein product [Oikopleura dioica]
MHLKRRETLTTQGNLLLSKEKRMMTISQISTSLKGPQMSLRTKKSKLKVED